MWKDAYKLGVDQLDQQHKQLIDTLQDLLCALQEGRGSEACRSLMTYFKDYTVVHFGAEEMYQARIGFYDAERHRQMHEGFKTELREMEFELIRNDFDEKTVTKLAQMLTRWLIWHILKEDRKMMAPAAEAAGAETARAAGQAT